MAVAAKPPPLTCTQRLTAVTVPSASLASAVTVTASPGSGCRGRWITLLTTGASRATPPLGAPGVPRSPPPNTAVEVDQLAPTLLSPEASSHIIDAPLGSGQTGPPSHMMRSISVRAVFSSTISSSLLPRSMPLYW